MTSRAAVIASNAGYDLPKLPEVEVLLAQRSLRALGRITIDVQWGYDMHTLSLPFERWIRILGGEGWVIGEPYWYEGERFTGTWSFSDSRELEVTYDDGGVGWTGTLAEVDAIDGPKFNDIDLAKLALSAST